MGDLGSIPGLGRSPRDRNSYPLQYSGLENSMDCIVHRITKDMTEQLSLSLHYPGDINSHLVIDDDDNEVQFGFPQLLFQHHYLTNLMNS